MKTHIFGLCRFQGDYSTLVSENPTCKYCNGTFINTRKSVPTTNLAKEKMSYLFEQNNKKKKLAKMKRDLYARGLL